MQNFIKTCQHMLSLFHAHWLDGRVMFYRSTSVPNTALSAYLKTADNIDQTNSLMLLRTSVLYLYKCCLWNITTGKLPGVRWG
jgi:hypothetical protein